MCDKDVGANSQYSVWGFFGTLLWSLLVAFIYVATQVVALLIYVVVRYGNIAPDEYKNVMANIEFDGVFLGICTFVSLLVCGPLIWGIVKLKKNSNVRHYLAMNHVRAKTALYWVMLIGGLIVISDLLTYSLGKPIVPEFMSSVYTSTDHTWLIWFALVVGAPLVEEFFFRGFLISGLSSSFVGPVGAVLLTSAGWAAIHVQYDLFTWMHCEISLDLH